MDDKQSQALARLIADKRLLVTAEDVCDIIGCNPQSIRNAIKAEGERSGIPAITLGTRVWIKRIPFLASLGISVTQFDFNKNTVQ